MNARHATGAAGEDDVISRVDCPNCRKALMRLPRNYPLFDIQCTGCMFRAQVKTSTCAPRDTVLGAGWDVLSKVLKSGLTIPPLMVNYRWPRLAPTNQVIHFYPFIPIVNVKKYQLGPTHRRANYRMFTYVGLSKLPHFVLYDSR